MDHRTPAPAAVDPVEARLRALEEQTQRIEQMFAELVDSEEAPK